MKDCNLPKPAFARFTAKEVKHFGHAVFDPEGLRVSDYMPFRLQAETRRAQLQREADAKAKRGPRACMCCGETFDSEGIHHRLCNGCRARNDGGSMGIATNSIRNVRRQSRA